MRRRRFPSPAFLLLPLALSLPGCGNVERLSRVGRVPEMSPVSNPAADPAWRPVSMPMPAPQDPPAVANSLWRPGSRTFLRDQRADRGRVQHVQHVRTMRHLHRRRVRVAVGGNDFHAQALQLDGHFLAQFPGSQQQDAGGGRGQWGSKSGHAHGS